MVDDARVSTRGAVCAPLVEEESAMATYGWIFLAIAAILGATALTGYAGPSRAVLNVAALFSLLISIVLFVADNREERLI